MSTHCAQTLVSEKLFHIKKRKGREGEGGREGGWEERVEGEKEEVTLGEI